MNDRKSVSIAEWHIPENSLILKSLGTSKFLEGFIQGLSAHLAIGDVVDFPPMPELVEVETPKWLTKTNGNKAKRKK